MHSANWKVDLSLDGANITKYKSEKNKKLVELQAIVESLEEKPKSIYLSEVWQKIFHKT